MGRPFGKQRPIGCSPPPFPLKNSSKLGRGQIPPRVWEMGELSSEGESR